MRILFDEQIFSNQRVGGISRYYSELVKALNITGGATARILSPLCTNQYARDLPSSYRLGLPFPAIPGSEKFVWHVNRLFSSPGTKWFKPDIVHQTYFSRYKLRRQGSRVVVTVHDMMHELHPENFPDSALVSSQKLHAVENADLVICVSENTRKDLLAITGIDRAKTAVVYHGIDHLRPSPSKKPVAGIQPYLLYVGLRHTYKNFDGLIKAFGRCPEINQRFNLVCFGGGPLSPHESDLIAKLNIPRGKIILTQGNDAVLCALYRYAEAFVYPSVYEGFGFPPLEAMSQGCPVVSSNTSSLPEVLGDAAEYFDPHDVDDMAGAIQRVIGQPNRARELKDSGLRRAQKYTWAKCAQRTLQCYRDIR
jgi:glycosyltransferase involved in cell wall biosynthesis